MVNKGNAAVWAAKNVAALPADDAGSETPTIQKEETLLVMDYAFFEGLFHPA
jgi:hypothetical protein